MPSITLDAIKAEQSRLAAMIASFEKQKTFPITIGMPDLNDGQTAIGAIVTPDGSRSYWLILLPGERESICHEDAMKWAKSIGGELPDRVESALLFQTVKDEFKDDWYWTRELHASASGCAWLLYFGFGDQGCDYPISRLSARAVRRLPI